MKSYLCAVALLHLVSLTMACSSTEFAGNGEDEDKKKAAEEIKTQTKTLSLSCEPGSESSALETKLESEAGMLVRLEGEFCGLSDITQAGQLSALFLLDFSGSMEDNDPTIGGSCGRLDATKAIVEKISAETDEDAEITFAAMTFDDNAQTIAPLQGAADFEGELDEARFCGFNQGYTNYEAALDQARILLSEAEGTRILYFISDGLPTKAGTGISSILNIGGSPHDGGRQAAKKLRDEIDGLAFNAIFLGANPTEPDPGGTGGTSGFPGPTETVDPEDYLIELTGDADSVKVVSDAKSLAREIVTFDTPEVVTINRESVTGVITAARFDDRNVAIESLEPHPTKENVWIFSTEQFELFGEEDETISNRVELTVETDAGKTQTVTALIDFRIAGP